VPIHTHFRRIARVAGLAAALLAQTHAVASGVEPDEHAYTHAVDVSLVVLQGSGWTTADVRDHVAEAAAVFAGCGVLLRTATLITLTPADADWVDTNLGVEESLAATVRSDLRLRVFFTRSDREGSWAYSYARPACGDAAICDTAWLTRDIFSDFYRRQAYPRGDATLAHELGHLLLPSPEHPLDGSVMDDTAARSARFSPAQCAAIRGNEAVAALRPASSVPRPAVLVQDRAEDHQEREQTDEVDRRIGLARVVHEQEPHAVRALGQERDPEREE
jgi:hypothetical protein